MSNPLIFISHKHQDKEIASVVSKFLKEKTLAQVDVFQSSEYVYEGPKLGANLNSELKKALWRCDTLILIYTSADNDWSYCMYECGVATHPNSLETKIVVFQCGKDVPGTFKDQLRVNARNQEDFKKFTKQLLTSPNFFPSLSKALAPLVEKETIEKAAKELFDTISKLLPNEEIDEWSAWPFLRIELKQADINRIINLPIAESFKITKEIIKENAVVVKSGSRISEIFGLNFIKENCKFESLLNKWLEKNNSEDVAWFDSCCEQILKGAKGELPFIKMVSLKEVDGDSRFTPVLSRVKHLNFSNSVHFDIHFYNLNDPRALPVFSRMIGIDNFFYKKIGVQKADSIKLKALVEELKNRGLNRIPILNDQNNVLYIIHRSMIDKFVADNVWGKPGISPADFTLQHLLDDNSMEDFFKKTFVVVPYRFSLAEAKAAMLAREGCSDIFITKNGGLDEPAIGWLTNIDIAKNY